MSQLLILIQNIGAVFLVICVGWTIRRRGFVDAAASSLLSRLVVDITLPCLVVGQMVRRMNWTTFRHEWPCMVLGSVEIFLPWLVALPLAVAFAERAQRPTFSFVVGMPNWIYLPLPIVSALYGGDGVRILLLYNVGVQLTMWSFCVWALRGGKAASGTSWKAILSPGLLATLFGVAVALILPEERTFAAAGHVPGSLGQLLLAMTAQTLEMIGSLTIPMSLVAIGVQLGDFHLGLESLTRPVWGVLLGRLLLAPLATVLVVSLLLRGFPGLSETTRMVGYLVATMPVALSCSVMAERLGGDRTLAAGSIFWTTLVSVATVPGLFWLVQRMGM